MSGTGAAVLGAALLLTALAAWWLRARNGALRHVSPTAAEEPMDPVFDRLGVFTYSPEEGTPSPAFPGQVDPEVAAERAAAVQEAQDAIAWDGNAKLVGSVTDVLVDGPSEDPAFAWEGRTAGQAPEIDGVVYLRGPRDFTAGRFARARVVEVQGYELVAERA